MLRRCRYVALWALASGLLACGSEPPSDPEPDTSGISLSPPTNIDDRDTEAVDMDRDTDPSGPNDQPFDCYGETCQPNQWCRSLWPDEPDFTLGVCEEAPAECEGELTCACLISLGLCGPEPDPVYPDHVYDAFCEEEDGVTCIIPPFP